MGVQGRSGLLNWATHLIHGTWTKSRKKTEQHEVLCKLLAHEGYEVIFLPIVLGSAGTLFQCLERATKELGILSTQKNKLYSKLHLHSSWGATLTGMNAFEDEKHMMFECPLYAPLTLKHANCLLPPKV